MESSNKLSMKKALRKVIERKLQSGTAKAKSFSIMKQPKAQMLQTNYMDAILSPEYAQSAKVPRQLGKETVALSRHITVPITVNILGNAAILFSPFYLKDDGVSASSLLLNNAATYDGVSTFGVGHTYIATPLLVPAVNVTDYRLVSASLHVVPQMSLTTSNGKIGGCICDSPFTEGVVGTTTTSYQNFATISYLESLRPYAEADVCIPESLRLVWYPYDNNDLCMYDINSKEAATYRENVLAAYITGAPASAKFNLELFWNFEVTPYPGSILSGMGSYAVENVEPNDVLRVVKSTPSDLAHAYVSTQHNHQSTSRSFALSTGNPPINDIISTIGKRIKFSRN
jgi:hypothetical protein